MWGLPSTALLLLQFALFLGLYGFFNKNKKSSELKNEFNHIWGGSPKFSEGNALHGDDLKFRGLGGPWGSVHLKAKALWDSISYYERSQQPSAVRVMYLSHISGVPRVQRHGEHDRCLARLHETTQRGKAALGR